MHRRKFLSMLGIAGAGAALAPAKAESATVRTFGGHPDAFGVLHDSTLCIGCRKCEEGCAKVNELPLPATDDLSVFEGKRRTNFQAFTVVNRYQSADGKKVIFRKHQCNHCQEPACASVCFVKAFKKNQDGSVTYDPSVCVGCRYCMIACPFYIPAYDYANVWNPLVYKCTMCAPRIREGKFPGCVEACPKGALVFGKRSGLVRLAWERINNNPGKYVRHVYGEHEAGGTNWLYINEVPAEEIGLPGLGKTTVPEMTAGALGAFAMVAGMWPVLLGGVYAINRRKDKVAEEEKDAAVETAVTRAQAEAKGVLEAALAKAAKDKDAAVASEVKKTKQLEEKIVAMEAAKIPAKKKSDKSGEDA